MLQPAKEKVRTDLKIVIGEGDEEGAASCTPREGLDEVSAKMLNNQMTQPDDRETGPIWYRDKQVRGKRHT